MPGINGCWKLQTMQGIDAQGNMMLPWGENIDGLLIYDPSGWMSLQIVKLYPQPDDTETFHSYFGRFEVDYNQKIITHTIQSGSKKEWINSIQTRCFNIKENNLELKSPPIELANNLLFEIITTWSKINDQKNK